VVAVDAEAGMSTGGADTAPETESVVKSLPFTGYIGRRHRSFYEIFSGYPLTGKSINKINTLTFQFVFLVLEPNPRNTVPSPLQYAANRLNAETVNPSPRDVESATNTSGQDGRARSGMNALRHGLPIDDMDDYRHSPKKSSTAPTRTPVERQFAQTVADNQRRCS